MEESPIPALLVVLLACFASSCTHGSDTRPPIWSYLSAAITEPNCATSGCHDQATAASGLDFSTPDRGYTSLTGSWLWIANFQSNTEHACVSNGGPSSCLKTSRSLVIPFDPAQSRLLQLLRGTAKPAMPPDRSLPTDDVALIEAWILNGATDDRAGSPAPSPTSPDGAQDGGHQ